MLLQKLQRPFNPEISALNEFMQMSREELFNRIYDPPYPYIDEQLVDWSKYTGEKLYGESWVDKWGNEILTCNGLPKYLSAPLQGKFIATTPANDYALADEYPVPLVPSLKQFVQCLDR